MAPTRCMPGCNVATWGCACVLRDGCRVARRPACEVDVRQQRQPPDQTQHAPASSATVLQQPRCRVAPRPCRVAVSRLRLRIRTGTTIRCRGSRRRAPRGGLEWDEQALLGDVPARGLHHCPHRETWRRGIRAGRPHRQDGRVAALDARRDGRRSLGRCARARCVSRALHGHHGHGFALLLRTGR